MKIKIHTLFPALLCGMIITASPALHAQNPAPATTPAAGDNSGGGQKGGGRRGGGGGANQLDRLVTELGLNDDQKAKLKPILDARQEKMKAVYGDTTLSADQKKAKMKEIMDASTTDIKAILTPDQAKKYDDFVQKMEERRKARQQNNS